MLHRAHGRTLPVVTGPTANTVPSDGVLALRRHKAIDRQEDGL